MISETIPFVVNLEALSRGVCSLVLRLTHRLSCFLFFTFPPYIQYRQLHSSLHSSAPTVLRHLGFQSFELTTRRLCGWKHQVWDCSINLWTYWVNVLRKKSFLLLCFCTRSIVFVTQWQFGKNSQWPQTVILNNFLPALTLCTAPVSNLKTWTRRIKS